MFKLGDLQRRQQSLQFRGENSLIVADVEGVINLNQLRFICTFYRDCWSCDRNSQKTRKLRNVEEVSRNFKHCMTANHPGHVSRRDSRTRSLHGTKCLSDVSPKVAIHCLKSSRHFCNQFADHLLVLQLVKVGGRWMECGFLSKYTTAKKDLESLKFKSEAGRYQDERVFLPFLSILFQEKINLQYIPFKSRSSGSFWTLAIQNLSKHQIISNPNKYTPWN